MPTNIVTVSGENRLSETTVNASRIIKNTDLIVVASFVAIGLLATIAFAVFFPSAGDLSAFAGIFG